MRLLTPSLTVAFLTSCLQAATVITVKVTSLQGIHPLDMAAGQTHRFLLSGDSLTLSSGRPVVSVGTGGTVSTGNYHARSGGLLEATFSNPFSIQTVSTQGSSSSFEALALNGDSHFERFTLTSLVGGEQATLHLEADFMDTDLTELDGFLVDPSSFLNGEGYYRWSESAPPPHPLWSQPETYRVSFIISELTMIPESETSILLGVCALSAALRRKRSHSHFFS